MSIPIQSRVQRALAGFWERQQARAKARKDYDQIYASRVLPVWRVTRRPLDIRRDIYGSRTPHERVGVRRIA